METDITITLPLTSHGLQVTLVAAGIDAMTGLIFLTLGEPQRRGAQSFEHEVCNRQAEPDNCTPPRTRKDRPSRSSQRHPRA